MPTSQTKSCALDRASAKDLKKSPASSIPNASRNQNADLVKELAVKVLDRRKMLWVNGVLLALLVISILG